VCALEAVDRDAAVGLVDYPDDSLDFQLGA
jgi:hypothetical protein